MYLINILWRNAQYTTWQLRIEPRRKGKRADAHSLTRRRAVQTSTLSSRYRSRPRVSVCIYDIRLPLDNVYLSSSSSSLLFSTHLSRIPMSFNILFCLIIIHYHSFSSLYNLAHSDLLVFVATEIQTHATRYSILIFLAHKTVVFLF